MKRFILTIAAIAVATIVCAQGSISRTIAKTAPAVGYEASQAVKKAKAQAQQSSNILTPPLFSSGALSVDLTKDAKSSLSDHVVNIERMASFVNNQPVALNANPITEGRECSCGGKLEWTAKAYKEYKTCSLCEGTGTYGNETCTLCNGSGKDYVWKSGYVCKSCGKIYKE